MTGVVKQADYTAWKDPHLVRGAGGGSGGVNTGDFGLLSGIWRSPSGDDCIGLFGERWGRVRESAVGNKPRRQGASAARRSRSDRRAATRRIRERLRGTVRVERCERRGKPPWEQAGGHDCFA